MICLIVLKVIHIDTKHFQNVIYLIVLKVIHIIYFLDLCQHSCTSEYKNTKF